MALRTAVRADPRGHGSQAGLGLGGNDEAFPLSDLLGVQQLRRANRFGFLLPFRFTLGLLGRVFVQKLAYLGARLLAERDAVADPDVDGDELAGLIAGRRVQWR